MGYIVRNKDEVHENIKPIHTVLFVVLSFFTFFIVQGVSLTSVSSIQAVVMLLGFAGVGFMLWHFKSVTYIDAPKYMAFSLIRILQFLGRRTLEVYVVHLLIFRGVAMILYPDKYAFWDWRIAPADMVSIFI